MPYYFIDAWGHEDDTHYDKMIDVETAADQHFEMICEDQMWNNGDYTEEQYIIVSFDLDDDDNFININRDPYTVSYLHYHGDAKEHGRY
jgi:hypothetical protein